MKRAITFSVVFSILAIVSSCEKDEIAENNNNPADTTSIPTDTIPTDTITDPPDTVAPKLGLEILRIEGLNMSVWVNENITLEQFNAIDLPLGWMKTDDQEFVPDSGYFSRSPFEQEDNQFIEEEHFGYTWLYNAHVTDLLVDVPDDDGLFQGLSIEKHHTVIFNEGRTLSVLTSPDGEQYVRITRDAARTQEVPTIPSNWQLSEYVTTERLTIELPTPILNVIADNQDAFQGPVSL